jgi:hypothetical protein
MASLPTRRQGSALGRRSSFLDKVDNGLLVVAVVIAALFMFHIVGWIAGAIFTLVKFAVLAGVIYVGASMLVRRRRH